MSSARPTGSATSQAGSPSIRNKGETEVEHEDLWPRPGDGSCGRSGSVQTRARGTMMSIQEEQVGAGIDRDDLRVLNEEEEGEEDAVNPSELANMFVEEEGSELLESEGDLTAEGSWHSTTAYVPSSVSNICEAAYRRIADICLSKAAEEVARSTKKKATSGGKSSSYRKGGGGKSVSEGSAQGTKGVDLKKPEFTLVEGLDVFRYILEEFVSGKYIDKSFYDGLSEEMTIFRRELPILRAEEVERKITKFSISLSNHVLSHSPHVLVAQNKHIGFRIILFDLLALVGIIYFCCPLTNDDVVSHFIISPCTIQFMEEVGIDVIGSITGGVPENVEVVPLMEDTRRGDDCRTGTRISTSSEAVKAKRKGAKKSSKRSSKRGKKSEDDGRCCTLPLHPKTIFKRADIAVSDREAVLKDAGFQPHVDQLRKWTREIAHGKVKESMDDMWRNCSRLYFPDALHPVTSEDRHHMCAYQVRESVSHCVMLLCCLL